MIKAKLKTPDYRTFVNKLLPEVMKQIHEAILSKLKMASSIKLPSASASFDADADARCKKKCIQNSATEPYFYLCTY